MSQSSQEFYISVDVETAGSNPREYSMLSIGACVVFKPEKTFYVELQPVNDNFVAQALAVTGLNMDELKLTGIPPKNAMSAFSDWVEQITPKGQQPIFAAFNAPFDWMFIHDYFIRFLGNNPFGHKALDIKAYYMGMADVPWSETGMRFLASKYMSNPALTHHALQDAIDQAEIFRNMLAKK